jgi:hypothetical protein
VVTVKLHGRLGNNLFQYALGRVIAEHHGLALHCVDVNPVKTHSEAGAAQPPPDTLAALTSFLPNARLDLDGREVAAPVERFEITPQSRWSGMIVDLPGILADTRPRQILLSGYFQRIEYLQHAHDRLRRWFALTGVAPDVTPAPRDVLINIRRDRGWALRGWALPLSYYEGILRRLSDVGRVYVCGTGIDEDVRACLAEYDPVYLDGPPIAHLANFLAFNRIVLSNSTFAWWGGYLSHASEIYAPHSGDRRGFAFTGWEDVDLHMREERYRAVDVPAFSRVTELVLSPAAAVRLWDAGRDTILEPAGAAGTVTCGPRYRALVQRLFVHRERVDVTSAIQRPGGLGLVEFVDALAYGGLVSVRHRCADPAAIA